MIKLKSMLLYSVVEWQEPFELQAAIELRKMIPPGTNLVEIPVYRTATPYDLKPIQDAVPKFIVFSDFNKGHLQASADLTNILLSELHYIISFIEAKAQCDK